MPVRTNLLQLLDAGRLTSEGAHGYARRWLLEPDAEVARTVESLLNRSSRTYAACYTEGVRLCRRFVNGSAAAFKRLLSEQITTDDLLAADGHDPRS
jgi:hypothetical protein